jgi:hypothetical protein
MIPAIAAHFLIGLGGLVCGRCGRKICRHRSHIVITTTIFLLAEATTSVIVIDSLLA